MNIPLFLLEKTDSTMNEIKKEKYSSYNNVAVVANSQTKGKGRRKMQGFPPREIYFYL